MEQKRVLAYVRARHVKAHAIVLHLEDVGAVQYVMAATLVKRARLTQMLVMHKQLE